MRVADEVAAVLRAEAAGDDHLAVRMQRLADRVERLGDRAVDEAAGVDDDEIRALVRRRHRVALGLELREDLLGVDERLRAAERNEADAQVRCRRVGLRIGAEWARRAHAQDWSRDRGGCALHNAPAPGQVVRRVQRFLSSSPGCGALPKFGNGNAANMPRVWSCIRCCMSMNSFALCSR